LSGASVLQVAEGASVVQGGGLCYTGRGPLLHIHQTNQYSVWSVILVFTKALFFVTLHKYYIFVTFLLLHICYIPVVCIFIVVIWAVVLWAVVLFGIHLDIVENRLILYRLPSKLTFVYVMDDEPFSIITMQDWSTRPLFLLY